jgi:hypothetical protein
MLHFITCSAGSRIYSNPLRIFYNGTAIWGGCVTRRSIRAESWYPATAGPEICHGASLPAGRQGGYGAVFAVMVQILLSSGAIAVQF